MESEVESYTIDTLIRGYMFTRRFDQVLASAIGEELFCYYDTHNTMMLCLALKIGTKSGT